MSQNMVQGLEHFQPDQLHSMQLFTFFRRGFLGFRKRNKPHSIPVVAAIIVVNSLPETQEAPPKECKQLHAVELVRLEVLKSLNHVLRHCVALVNLENLEKMTKQKCPSKTLDFVTSTAK